MCELNGDTLGSVWQRQSRSLQKSVLGDTLLVPPSIPGSELPFPAVTKTPSLETPKKPQTQGDFSKGDKQDVEAEPPFKVNHLHLCEANQHIPKNQSRSQASSCSFLRSHSHCETGDNLVPSDMFMMKATNDQAGLCVMKLSPVLVSAPGLVICIPFSTTTGHGNTNGGIKW